MQILMVETEVGDWKMLLVDRMNIVFVAEVLARIAIFEITPPWVMEISHLTPMVCSTTIIFVLKMKASSEPSSIFVEQWSSA